MQLAHTEEATISLAPNGGTIAHTSKGIVAHRAQAKLGGRRLIDSRGKLQLEIGRDNSRNTCKLLICKAHEEYSCSRKINT
jgi:hypothetical protein